MRPRRIDSVLGSEGGLRRGRPRCRTALLAFAFAAFLSACVDVDATASIGPDGSGRLSLRYTASRMVSPLGSLEAGKRLLPFPLSRDDFEGAVSASEGLALVSYSEQENSDAVTVNAAVSFASSRALAAFLDPTGARAVYFEEGGRHGLRLVIAAGGEALDPDVARLVDTAFASNRAALTLVLPVPVISAGIGTARGTQAVYSGTVATLIKSVEPIIWEIVW